MRGMSRAAAFVNDHFFACVLVMAAAGLLVPRAAALTTLVSPILFVMILGMGLTLPLSDFVGAFRRPGRIAAVLAVQYTVLPLIGWLLGLLVSDPDLRIGLLIVACAPSEITSALMVFLAKGDAAFATGVMSLSVLAAPFVMPSLLALLAGQSVSLDVGAMLLNLVAIVAVPVLLGSVIRTRVPALSRYTNECTSVASVMVLVLILVAAANARGSLSIQALGLAGLVLLFNLAGYLVGWITGKAVVREGDARAFVFTIGMKEFGVAMAVALAFFPSAAALPATIYGVIMLITAPYLVKRLRGYIREAADGAAHEADSVGDDHPTEPRRETLEA